ncbi:MAG: DUF4416 family protein [Thermodesulfobacteriota bacterium]|nr:MAG: DUF4416 family protein [Thermodesulfobacteriota bacterium]
MTRVREPEKVKLVVSLFTVDRELFLPVLKVFEGRFGAIDFLSEPLDFDSTDYYDREFGEGGKTRRVVSFQEHIETGDLSEIKVFSNGVEEEFLRDGRRRINIDPGYITLERFVLASCKNFSHRVHVGGGVYADLTLVFRRGAFRALDWTYPDYSDSAMIEILTEIRRRYAFKIQRGLRIG